MDTFGREIEFEGFDRVVRIESWGVSIVQKKDIPTYVEGPLIEACEIFFDKNIITTLSSANLEGGEVAYIDIDYTSLSSTNRQIIEEMGCEIIINHGSNQWKDIRLGIPISKESDVVEIERYFSVAARKFEMQSPLGLWVKDSIGLWHARYAADEIFYAKECNFYHDESSGLFFWSEELLRRARMYQRDVSKALDTTISL